MRELLAAIRIAFRAIARSKLRAALTILGILIGVAAVVIVVALGTGTRDAVTRRFSTLGANIIYIWPQATQQSGVRASSMGRLTEGDGEALAQGGDQHRHGGALQRRRRAGGDRRPQLADARRWAPRAPTWRCAPSPSPRARCGRETDEQLKTKVVVLGDAVREALFGNQDGVGQYVRIGRYAYRVVGVLAKKGNSPFGEDQDDRLLMPIGSHRARVAPHAAGPRGEPHGVGHQRAHRPSAPSRRSLSILKQRHHIQPEAEPDFVVRSPLELRRTLETIFDTLTLLLSAIAGVALLVGGVGVMNIMLVSVTERTREIGIRMAIGAQATDILVQFLVEAVTLCLIGGVVGIALRQPGHRRPLQGARSDHGAAGPRRRRRRHAPACSSA